ncbi:MAG: FAD-binding oxidoreductase [Rhodospirillaceae bacterium]|nr:MAG: FAD-binding oxidoreductase [Rhodospirillaceae bacterium]
MSVRTARRIPGDLRGSGWYRLLPAPAPPRILEGRQKADWVIIGAGFAGLSAARRLSQLAPGDRIAVLEAQRIGWGAAGRNSGFMIDLPHELSSETYAGGLEHDLKQIRMNRAGIDFAAGAAEEYGLAAHFVRAGKYHGAATNRGLDALAQFEKHLAHLKEPFEHLDADAMRRLTGTAFYVGGTFTPGTVMIQPAAYIRGVAQGLSSAVDIFEETPALSIETGTEHIVTTAKGEIRTPRLILANNGHVENFGFFRRRLMHIFTFASMTRQLSAVEMRTLGGENAWGLIPADPMGSTIRRIAEGRIVVRNTFTYNPDMQTSEQQIDSIGESHDLSFAARFPTLKNGAQEYRWGGHLCLSLNAVPAFGEIETRVYAACCCNGLGTVKGTLYGKLAADLAAGTREPLVEDVLAEAAPEKLYPEPLMTWGAKAKLWWVQKRAGREL